MNQEPIKPPSFLAKKMLFGENVIYHCKSHKGLWIFPLMFAIGGILFITGSGIDNTNILTGVGGISLFMFLFFVLELFIYLSTDLILTNQRIIARQFFAERYIKLEDVAIVRYIDAMTEFQNAGGYTKQKRGMAYGFLFLLDVVTVNIVNKDANDFATIEYIGLLDFKQFKKLFDAECEKRENNDF